MKPFFYLFFFLPLVLSSQSNWQQKADYNMNVSVDVKTFEFSGSQEIVYTNNSPDTIRKVYYHLYFNAFKPGSQMDVRSLNISDPGLTNISIYPNPVVDKLFIQGLLRETKVSIYNVLGKLVVSKTTLKSIDVDHLQSGIYIVKIVDGKQETVKKFIKK